MTTTTSIVETTTPPAPECDLEAGDHSLGERSYHLTVPTSLGAVDSATGPASPLLLLLHGFSGNAVEIAATTGLDRLAPESGVVLAAPQGAGEPATWHIGADDDPAVIDDREFLGSLVDTLVTSACIDADNVWLAGFSAGSAYTGVFGCSEIDRFAGLAMVSGLPPALCPDEAGVSIQITHGVADAIVPFDGGDQTVSDTSSVELESVPASAARWAAQAGCGDPAEAVLGSDDPSRVTTWSGCAHDARVSLLAVDGLNHVWAGGESPVFLEPIEPIVDASCVIIHTMTERSGDPFESCFG